MKNIIPIWQPIGFSTSLISQRVGEYYNVKSSHTGTIDPMASGVIIVLLDKERLKKYEYAHWLKEYEFEITFGIETDTYDGLGLRAGTALSRVDTVSLEAILADMVGEYTQHYPMYSTKKIKGKHLHEYARNNQNITLPKKKGKIISIELVDLKEEETTKIVDKVISNIKKVSGDFRQQEIISQWEVFQGQSLENVVTAKFKTTLTKGLYVRSLSQDICKKLGTIGFVSELVRTKNGEYSKNDCKNLEEIFGKDYLERYDFESNYKFS